MKHLLLLIALLGFAQSALWAQQAQKRWGLAWSVPKGWTKKNTNKPDELHFVSGNENADVRLIAMPIPANETDKMQKISNFFANAADLEFSPEDLKPLLKKGKFAGYDAMYYEDMEEADDEDDDEDEAEGYWVKVYVVQTKDKLVLLAFNESFGKRRKMEKVMTELIQSFKKG